MGSYRCRRFVCAALLLLLAAVLPLSSGLSGLVLRNIKATDWWQRAGFYQIYPRSYKDSDGDGIGDLKGITEKLPYIKEIGMHAFWLSPIYKSPMADFGYDIADFRDVHPDYGTMADFEAMVKKAKEVGLKVILDFVPNHSSDEHEWFVKSENSEGSYTDYYVWRDGKSETEPPNNWVEAFRGSAWKYSEKRKQYYLHQFHYKQPDLNYRNPLVVEEMKNVLRFWLGKGVDGFRVDAVPWLFEDVSLRDEPISGNSDDPLRPEYLNHIYTQDLPETVDMVYQWREVLDSYQKENGGDTRILMTEAWSGLNIVQTYFQDVNKRQGSQMPFNFQLILYLNEKSTAKDFHSVIQNWLSYIPDDHTPNWVLGNHDKRRIASRMGGEHMVDIMEMVELSLPGVSVTYQGEEIGMLDYEISWEETLDPAACQTSKDVYQLYTRDPARTPFQWSNSSMAGFTTGTKTWLPVNTNYATVNVETEKAATISHLKNFMELMKIRAEDDFQNCIYGTYPLSDDVFVVLRVTSSRVFLTIANLADKTSTVNAASVVTSVGKSCDNFWVRVRSATSKRSLKETVDLSSLTLQPWEALVVESSGVLRHLSSLTMLVATLSMGLLKRWALC
ncbi:maltase 2-like [Uranotaenia lowii]|uniref:maltase 2-like n=1 Tax=Uranotaenia lowii TaxID=190385 RepID=UPI002478D6F4|nr:maltase 2-like [Uranotaenia lowii]